MSGLETLTSTVDARSVKTNTTLRVIRGSVGPGNNRDDIRITIRKRASFSFILNELQSNAALQLLTRAKRVIATSNRPGNRPERINRVLSPGTYFLRVSRRAGRTNYSLRVIDNTSPQNTPPSDPTQNLWGNYSGVAFTRIGTLNLAGQVVAINDYQNPIGIEIRSRRQAAGLTESNPINLSIFSLDQGALGGFFLTSAQVSSTFSGNLLVQYWNLQLSGSQLSGNLTNTGASLALAANLINTPPTGLLNLLPFQPMGTTTTLQGTATPSEVRLRIQGLTTNAAYAYVIDVVAQR